MNHLASPFASTFDIPLIESLVSAMVQFFYAYRVWVLSNKRSRWLCLIILLVGRSGSSLWHHYVVLSSFSALLSMQQQELLAVFMFVLSSIFACQCILTHYHRLIYEGRSLVIGHSKTLLLYEFDPYNLLTELIRLTAPACSPGCP